MFRILKNTKVGMNYIVNIKKSEYGTLIEDMWDTVKDT